MQYFVLSTGTNLGDRVDNLLKAKTALCEKFLLIEESRIYESPAVDYLNQPDFLNQVLHFDASEDLSPQKLLETIMEIERLHGRTREIDKGPRTIDIDILFIDNEKIDESNLQVPHPRLFERSFITNPLKELRVFKELSQTFEFNEVFDNTCWVLPS